MKRVIPIEIILVLVVIGIVIGIAYSRWEALKTQLANHNTRITFLESEHKNRLRLRNCIAPVLEFAIRCFQKAAFGFLKSH